MTISVKGRRTSAVAWCEPGRQGSDKPQGRKHRADLGWAVVCPQSMGILGGEAGYQSGLGGLAGKDLASDDLGGPFWRQLCGEAEWLCRPIQGLSMALRQTRPWPAAAGILRTF